MSETIEKQNAIYLTVFELQDIADALSAAMDDIRQHVQVAKYNLRGECCGELMPRPNPPMFVHERGIAASENAINRCRKVWLKIWNHIQDEQPHE